MKPRPQATVIIPANALPEIKAKVKEALVKDNRDIDFDFEEDAKAEYPEATGLNPNGKDLGPARERSCQALLSEIQGQAYRAWRLALDSD